MNSFQKTALWIVKGAIFVVPFIPLYVAGDLFFPFITGKAFVFRLLVQIMLAVWVTLALFYKEYRPRKSLLLYALVAFLAIITLASIFGVNPARSFWSNFERMEGLLAHLHLFAYFLVAAHVMQKKDWIVFFNFFVVAGLGQNIVAFLQKIGTIPSPQGIDRTDGTIGNATYVAAYSIFVLAISLLLFLRTKVLWARVWYGFMALFTLLAIYFTATRGAILALFMGAVVSGVLYLFIQKTKAPRERRYKKIVIGVLVVLVVAAGLLVAFRKSSFVQGNNVLSRLASISLKEGSSRFLIWNMGLQGFKERPILGWGLENYNAIFAKHYDPRLYSQEPWFDRSHNIAFDWLINAGVLGLIAYLSIFATALFVLWKRYHAIPENDGEKQLWLKTAILISVLFFVYLAQNLFVFDQFTTYMSFFSVLAYIQTFGTEAKKQGREGGTPVRQGESFKWAGTGVALIGLALAVYFVNYTPFMANKNLLQAFQERNIKDLPRAFDQYKKALSYGALGKTEIREQLAQFAIAAMGSPDLDQTFKEKVFERTIVELRQGEKTAPHDPRIPLFLGAVYAQAGVFEEAVKAFERSLVLSPRKQQIYFELGDLYIRQGDFKRAQSVLEKAFKLEPKFDQARINAVAGYILNDNQARADELLTEAYGRTDVAQPILAQVYSRKKDYPRLLAVWQAFLKSDRSKIEYWKNVAAIQLQLGKRTEAIQTLQEAITFTPSFKEEGEGYIQEIRAGRNP